MESKGGLQRQNKTNKFTSKRWACAEQAQNSCACNFLENIYFMSHKWKCLATGPFVMCLSIKSYRQQALDRQWTQKWQSPHTGDATPQNLSNAVCKRRDSFLAFTQHPHATCAQRARLVGAHAAVTPYQSTCHQDGRRAGAKCAALAGPNAILNSLPSPTHLETKVVGKRGPLPAPSTVARSGGHHHDFA